MTLAAQAHLYCTQIDVEDLISALGVQLRLDDDGSGTVDEDEQRRMTRALNWATAKVKFYALTHYADADLATSHLVNDWATILAAHWLCSTRLNPVPDSIQGLAFGRGGNDRGVMGDLEDVRAKRAQIPDIGYRNVDWPAWGNVFVDARYRVRQIRVQRPISESTPTQYGMDVDREAEVNPEI